jgi:enamine deaminase RidA (YjgF/YER057c/UK114 family)
MPTFRSIVPNSLELLHSKRGHSPGVCVNGFLFVSGMLGRDRDLNVIPDPEEQLRQMFENFGLVLGEAGCGWADVVELTGYFIDLRRDFDLFMAVRDRYMGKPYPAMTMIGAAALAHRGLICELKGTAKLRG